MKGFVSSQSLSRNILLPAILDFFIKKFNMKKTKICSSPIVSKFNRELLSSHWTYLRRKSLTPASFKSMIMPLQSVFAIQRQFFCRVINKENSWVQSAPQCDLNNDLPLKEAHNKEDTEDNVENTTSPKLLETIIVFQRNWIFVTQFQVYYRNNASIDTSVIGTMMDKNPSKLFAKAKRQDEERKVLV